jgi:hypothetical protein
LNTWSFCFSIWVHYSQSAHWFLILQKKSTESSLQKNENRHAVSE